MKTFIIAIIGLIMINAHGDFTAFVGAALVAWAYYRCGKADGIAQGKRQALSSGTKLK